MAPNNRLADAAPTAGNVLIQQQFDYVAQVVAAMNRVAEMRQILAESAAESVIACVEAAVNAQQEITAMTTDAASAQDPVALLSLPHRAFQTSLHHGMVCATRNVQAAQALGSRAFGRTENPDSGETQAS